MRGQIEVTKVGTVDVPAPRYATPGSAGMDLCAAIPSPLVLGPGEWALVPTGWAMAIPPGYEGQVRPRSGLALRHGITVLNAPGTIDSDYRGEIGALLINHGRKPYTVEPGARVAQLAICPVAHATLEVVDALEDTARGAGGYGSTGIGRDVLPTLDAGGDHAG